MYSVYYVSLLALSVQTGELDDSEANLSILELPTQSTRTNSKLSWLDI